MDKQQEEVIRKALKLPNLFEKYNKDGQVNSYLTGFGKEPLIADDEEIRGFTLTPTLYPFYGDGSHLHYMHLCVNFTRNGFPKAVNVAWPHIAAYYRPMHCCGMVEFMGFGEHSTRSNEEPYKTYTEMWDLFLTDWHSKPTNQKFGLVHAVTNRYQTHMHPIFEKLGYKPMQFFNPNSGNYCNLWQKLQGQKG